MNWDYRLAQKVVKNLKRFPISDCERIIKTLEEMKLNPFSGDVKPIQGEENLYRRRVGSYRIYFRPVKESCLLDIPDISRKQSR